MGQSLAPFPLHISLEIVDRLIGRLAGGDQLQLHRIKHVEDGLIVGSLAAPQDGVCLFLQVVAAQVGHVSLGGSTGSDHQQLAVLLVGIDHGLVIQIATLVGTARIGVVVIRRDIEDRLQALLRL